MEEKFFGYQIWKPVDSKARNAVLEQMKINNVFENQPTADKYVLFSEEILNVHQHYELMKGNPGYGTTIWDMAKNYRKFKGEDLFELGDVICIYHASEFGKKRGACFLTVGHYFYGWDKDENNLLRDYAPVQQSWAIATRTSLY